VIVGLLVNSGTSRTAHERLGIPATALVMYLAGAAALRLLRSVPAGPLDNARPRADAKPVG
jgi:hypothetical protein